MNVALFHMFMTFMTFIPDQLASLHNKCLLLPVNMDLVRCASKEFSYFICNNLE